MDKPQSMIPRNFAASSVEVFSPSRQVVTDMVMVQFISAILVLTTILLFNGNQMSPNSVTASLIGLFVSGVFLTTIYSRLR